MKFLVVLSALVVSTLAHDISPNVIFRRQTASCATGKKVCGDGCISVANTCCPDGSGGCEPTENCQLGSNGEYGCCPKGKTCTGSGGAYTSLYTNTYAYTTSRATASITTSRATATAGGSNICDAGWKSCGDTCIPTGWTCCADKRGGCNPAIASCWLGSDGFYGCCENPKGCTGVAGDVTTIASDYTSASTTRTTSSVRTTSTALPVGGSTTRTSTTSRSTATSLAAGSSSEAHPAVTNPFASLFSFFLAVAAVFV